MKKDTTPNDHLDDWQNGGDWNDDGYCDLCGGKAVWAPTGEPALAFCGDPDRHKATIKRMRDHD